MTPTRIKSQDIEDGTIAVGDLSFDPATQTELDALTTRDYPEAVGTVTVATAKTRLLLRRAAFTSTQRLTIQGTGRVMILG